MDFKQFYLCLTWSTDVLIHSSLFGDVLCDSISFLESSYDSLYE